tara:strand:- start:909 stop:1568 length:660 start_codon:yes stop_codon:yes gene_type:complete
MYKILAKSLINFSYQGRSKRRKRIKTFKKHNKLLKKQQDQIKYDTARIEQLPDDILDMIVSNLNCIQLSTLYISSFKLQKYLSRQNPKNFLNSLAFDILQNFDGDFEKYLNYLLFRCEERALSNFENHPMYQTMYHAGGLDTFIQKRMYKTSDDWTIRLDMEEYIQILFHNIDLDSHSLGNIIEVVANTMYQDMFDNWFNHWNIFSREFINLNLNLHVA